MADFDGAGIIELVVDVPLANINGIEADATWILYLDTNGAVAGKKEISTHRSVITLPVNDGDNFAEFTAKVGDLDKDDNTDLDGGKPLLITAKRVVALY